MAPSKTPSKMISKLTSREHQTEHTKSYEEEEAEGKNIEMVEVRGFSRAYLFAGRARTLGLRQKPASVRPKCHCHESTKIDNKSMLLMDSCGRATDQRSLVV